MPENFTRNGWKWVAVVSLAAFAIGLAAFFGGWTWDDGMFR